MSSSDKEVNSFNKPFSQLINNTEFCVTKDQPAWSVLQDNFIMGGKIKNWDHNVDENGVEVDPNADPSEGKSNFKNKNGKVVKNKKK